MTAQTRLLRQLADGGFHSGQLLARELGISRTAVWKRLKGLERELGLQLQAVRGRDPAASCWVGCTSTLPSTLPTAG